MKRGSVFSHSLSTLQSPEAPSYRDEVRSPKGCSSEQLPLPSKSSRRNLSAASLISFNGGRTLPSKWEDAERWIFSPVSGNVTRKNSLSHPHKRPKSLSGPIVPPGIAYYSNYSPIMQGLEGGGVRNFLVGSPPTPGSSDADGLHVHYSSGDGRKYDLGHSENNLAVQLASLPRWSKMLSEPSMPSSQDEKLHGTKETIDSQTVSLRDKGTQMSPGSSINSSPRGKSSFSPNHPSFPRIRERQGAYSSKSEVRDVQVDQRATASRWSRNVANVPKEGFPHVEGSSKDATEAQASSWDIAEAEMNISRLQREDAKISAWENLQKAKAEAAMRKLEMSLEKKRSSTMDKILNKLRKAERKAQRMRGKVLDHQGHQVTKTSRKVVSFSKYVWKGFFRNCFTSGARKSS